jgi:hypothetical protein
MPVHSSGSTITAAESTRLKVGFLVVRWVVIMEINRNPRAMLGSNFHQTRKGEKNLGRSEPNNGMVGKNDSGNSDRTSADKLYTLDMISRNYALYMVP